MSFYEEVGGEATFRRLVKVFYDGVREDALLRPLYPEEDLDAAEDRLALFLMQYWGGPTTYSEQRGHPRLRMRHAPFPIDEDARDAWLAHMRAAVDAVELDDAHEQQLWLYFLQAAASLQNRAGRRREA
jgi:hemoglobin